MIVGNNGGDVHNVVLDAGNDGVGVRGIMMSGRNGRICVDCVYCKCLPGAESQLRSSPEHRTHVKNRKNLFEARPPGRDRFFVFLGVETPRDCIALTPLDKFPLDICYGPVNKGNMVDGSR